MKSHFIPMLLKAKTTALSVLYVKHRKNKTAIEMIKINDEKIKYKYHHGGQHRLDNN